MRLGRQARCCGLRQIVEIGTDHRIPASFNIDADVRLVEGCTMRCGAGETYFARHVVFSRLLDRAEEMQAIVFVPNHSHRGLLSGSWGQERSNDHDIFYLWEDDGPLEGCAVQVLALSTMAVFRVYRVAVTFKGNISTPTFAVGRSNAAIVPAWT